jgi:hypothetical protein
MEFDELTVQMPYKAGYEDQSSIAVWPLVEKALGQIGAEEITYDAVKVALLNSAGSIVLANYLLTEGLKVHKMDLSFRAPLLVLAANHALEDEAAYGLYDEEVGFLYFETDDYQFGFSVMKDWKIDWTQVADEVVSNYEPPADINGGFALDILLSYADVAVDAYRRQDDDL